MEQEIPQGNTWGSGERSPEHRRDPQLEELLRALNTYMAEGRGRIDAPTVPERPVVFIVGCARAGSTILLQSLAATGELTYPTNIISRFYEDPYIGAIVHRILYDLDSKGEIFPVKDPLAFNSVLGKSRGAASPHEFNYLWRKYFKFGELQSELVRSPDAAQKRELVRDLAAIEFRSGKPVIMKAMELNWHIPLLRFDLPRAASSYSTIATSCTMRCPYSRRGRRTKAASRCGIPISPVRMRPSWIRRLGNKWSPRSGIRSRPWNIAATLPGEDVQRVSYADLCRAPREIVDKLWTRLGIKAKYTGPASFEISEKPVPEELEERAALLLGKLAKAV
ncbi:MAG: hypothetical protein IPI81_02870 [Flavobacteriales bacterium]|nr:hypothetical protein [Flavobacteriales bacterium]